LNERFRILSSLDPANPIQSRAVELADKTATRMALAGQPAKEPAILKFPVSSSSAGQNRSTVQTVKKHARPQAAARSARNRLCVLDVRA
jgi:hypothetical protein